MSTGPTDDIVRLATTTNPAQAHVWEQALLDEGIRCKVVGDYLSSGVGGIPGFSAEIWVLRADLARAKEVLRREIVGPPPGQAEREAEEEAEE